MRPVHLGPPVRPVLLVRLEHLARTARTAPFPVPLVLPGRPAPCPDPKALPVLLVSKGRPASQAPTAPCLDPKVRLVHRATQARLGTATWPVQPVIPVLLVLKARLVPKDPKELKDPSVRRAYLVRSGRKAIPASLVRRDRRACRVR